MRISYNPNSAYTPTIILIPYNIVYKYKSISEHLLYHCMCFALTVPSGPKRELCSVKYENLWANAAPYELIQNTDAWRNIKK